MKKAVIAFIAVLGLLISGVIVYDGWFKSETQEVFEVIEEVEVPSFMLDSIPNKEAVANAILYYDLEYPSIVLSQAILESGHFTSDLCISKNNLFGLYDSLNGQYFEFTHWAESIEFYKNDIQKKWNEQTEYEDYYDFLENLPYATDPDYIVKIKILTHGNNIE